jgi:preprotein translocase subunit SecA
VGVVIIVLRTPPFLPSIDLDEEDDDYDDVFDEDEMEYTPPPSRNDLCPCGSGRKYKNCHGRNV